MIRFSARRPAREERSAIQRLQDVWESHAKADPLWAIISRPDKKGGKWDLAEFLETGEYEVENLLRRLALHDISFSTRAALDFGCGIGRLTHAFARRFDEVCGVDISPTMIEQARQLNAHPASCKYFVNASERLEFRDGYFSFIYSNVVLQHIEPQITRRYIAEFARVAKRGGLVIFQLPSRKVQEEGLPDGAWAVAIECDQAERSWPAGGRAVLHATVENKSAVVWQHDEHRPLMLGNHWLNERGEMIRRDDGRVMLPKRVAPGERVNLALEVTVPPAQGDYRIELDLVQEGVAWFQDRGSATVTLPVKVVPRADVQLPSASERDAETPLPAFEAFSMHCIRRAEVIELLHDCGLRLELIEESNCGGPGYQSYFYYARKL